MTNFPTAKILFIRGFILLSLVACKRTSSIPTANPALPPGPADTANVSAILQKANSFAQANFDSLRYYASKALALATQIQFSEGIGIAKGMEANYQRRRGNYEEAIKIGLEVINLYDSLKLWNRLVRMKNFVSDVYKEMGGEKGTSEYLQKALDLAKEGEDIAKKEKYIPGQIMSLNEQGIILRDMSERLKRPDLMDSAFSLYNRGMLLVKNTGEGEDELGPLYNNTAQVYNEYFKDYPKALEYQIKAVDFNTNRNKQTSLTHNYNTIAEIYMNMGDLEKANQYGHKMLSLCIQLNAPFRQQDAYAVLTDINKKMGRYDSALHYFELGTNLSDSLNNLKRSSQIAEVQTKYETVKKEEQISSLSAISSLKSRRLLLLGGAAGLLLILLSVVWWQKRKSQQQQQKISEQSEKLKWMMKELHHRVKNNLQIVSSLLNLQTYRLKDKESISAIKESQLRVQAMSLMHQRLYQVEDVSMVNFKLYLTDLVETLMKAYGYTVDKFDLQINLEKEMLEADTVMPMGLLVNEIITNSFKYAYEEVARPLLSINMKAGDDRLQLDIADNGPGMNNAANKQEGFGKKLIQALNKQLKATCVVQNGEGTHYTITIPYQTEKTA
jgi:two-component sensor histidine kinase